MLRGDGDRLVNVHRRSKAVSDLQKQFVSRYTYLD